MKIKNKSHKNILQKVLLKKAYSTKELSDKFNVSCRTIQRYLKDLDDIEYKNRRYVHPAKLPLKIPVLDLLGIFSEMTLGNTVSGDYDTMLLELEKYFTEISEPMIESSLFSEKMKKIILIYYAVFQKRVVSFDYKSNKDKNPSRRCIKPYYISYQDDFWYLDGAYEDRPMDKRRFSIYKMQNIKVEDRFFIEDQDEKGIGLNAFHSKDKLSKKKEIEVILLFTEESAAHFKRNKKFSSFKQRNEFENGSIEASIWISHPMEIIPVIQEWIPLIKIVEPDEIKSAIKENLKKCIEDL